MYLIPDHIRPLQLSSISDPSQMIPNKLPSHNILIDTSVFGLPNSQEQTIQSISVLSKWRTKWRVSLGQWLSQIRSNQVYRYLISSILAIFLSSVPLTAIAASDHGITNSANGQKAQHEAAKSQQPIKYISIEDLSEGLRRKTDVAISNYPLFLLSEAVTKGAPSGKLLLDAGDVGHHGSLSPSDMKTVKDSRYVVWFGEQLESNLVKPLSTSPNTISLFEFNAFKRLPLRDVKGQPIQGTLDPHIWLEPENAKAITRALGAIFSRANPKYKSVYAANVRSFAQKMDAAVASQQQQSMTTKPYWAYHDAFGYIESILNLRLAGALTADHHLPPKASQFYWLKQNRPEPTMCIILQSDSNQGVLSKLQPVRSSVQQEDMSGSSDFVSSWLALAEDINRCVGRTQ